LLKAKRKSKGKIKYTSHHWLILPLLHVLLCL